jgi:hypothetical protein
VYITWPPADSFVTDGVLVIARSTFGPTGTCALESTGGPQSAHVAVAVLSIAAVSELAIRVTTLNVCDAPLANDANVHVTVLAASLQPGDADTNDNALGNGSDTFTLVAASGPLLVTFKSYVSFAPGIPGIVSGVFKMVIFARHSEESIASLSVAVPELVPAGASLTLFVPIVTAFPWFEIGWTVAHNAAFTSVWKQTCSGSPFQVTATFTVLTVWLPQLIATDTFSVVVE